MVGYFPGWLQRIIEEHTSITGTAEESDMEQLKMPVRNHLGATLSILKERTFD